MFNSRHGSSTSLKRAFIIIIALACYQIESLNAAYESESGNVFLRREGDNAAPLLEIADLTDMRYPWPHQFRKSRSSSDSDTQTLDETPDDKNPPSLESRNLPSSSNSSFADTDSTVEMPDHIQARSFPWNLRSKIIPTPSSSSTSNSIIESPDIMQGRTLLRSLFAKATNPTVIPQITEVDERDISNPLLSKLGEMVQDAIEKFFKSFGVTGQNIYYALVWVIKQMYKLIRALLNIYNKIKEPRP